MNKCKACGRMLTSKTSKKYGFGSTCLKRVVALGNAPLESLEEMKQESKTKKPKKAKEQVQVERCDKTMDLFETAKNNALKLLDCAVLECKAYGIEVTYRIM